MPPKRRNGGNGPDSWQTKKDPTEVNRTAPRGDPNAPGYAEREAEAYHDHPVNSAGKRICGATKGNGSKCQKGAGTGTPNLGFGKCSMHGGNTPTLRTNAARFTGKEVARMSMGGYGNAVTLSPTDALLQEVERAAGHVAWISQRIDLWAMDTEKAITEEQQSWLDLYHLERGQLVKVAKIALDAGVDERRVRIAERSAANIVDMLKQVFEGLKLSVEQQKMIPVLVPAALREFAEPKVKYVESTVDRS